MNIKQLRQQCQPAYKQKTDPLMEWYLLRPISIYFTWAFVRLGLQSNHVSLLGLACGVAGSALLLTGDMSWSVAGAAVLWFAFLFDCVDGEVARYWGKPSFRGTYVDYMVGGHNDLMCLLGLSFLVAGITGWDPRWTVVPSMILAFSEKVCGLYVHSVVVRCFRDAWSKTEPNTSVDYDAAVWFEMPLMSRLVRVPFETFFRVNALLLASLAAVSLNQPGVLVAAWAMLLCLSAIVTGKGIFSEIFQNRVERTMFDFVNAIKARNDLQERRAA